MSYKKLSTIGNSIKEKFEILVPEIKTSDEKKNMINSFRICLIDVYAEWCGPCKITAPVFSNLFKNYNLAGVVGLAKENVELGLSPNVQVIPTFQFYVNGQFESVMTGADMDALEKKLVELIQAIGNHK
jgi:thioredoxin 1